jgi:hypothetical protein
LSSDPLARILWYMHHIQRHILGKLIHNVALRYSQLKPEHLDANLFTYHLKHLLKQELVCKRPDQGYSLTPKGKNMADKLQLENFELPWHTQPRLVILIAVRDDKKGWLLHRRSIQPVINMVGFLHANVSLGTSVLTTAEERLQTICGLQGSCRYQGSGLITIYQDDQLESYIDFHLVLCENPAGDLVTESDIGHTFWQQEIDYTADDLLPSMPVLCKKIEDKEVPFFTELTYRL